MLCAVAAVASTAAAEPALQLDEITVEASPIVPYLPARTEIGRDELIESHKSELDAELDLTPGINVRQGGRGEPRVDIRGFDQRAALITLNGVPVTEPYNGIVNIDLFPLEMLGRVSVMRGISSSLYGPNGMAGQIALETFRTPTPLTAAGSTIWRDRDFWDTRASAAANRGDLSGLVGGRYLTTPGFPLSDDFDARPETRRRFEDGGTRLSSDVQEWSAFGTLGHEYGEGGRAHLAVLASQARFGIPPSTTSYAPVLRRNDDQSQLHEQAGVDQRLRPALGIAGGVFYTRYSSTESQFDGPDYSTELLSTTADSDEIGGIGRLTLDLGVHDTLAVGGQVRGASASVSTSAGGPASEPDALVGSVGIENVYAATERLTLLVGLSYDVQSSGGDGTDGQLDPQGIVSYDFGAYGVTRLAVGRKVRFPTLRELSDPLQGNPDLGAEKALTYDLGHRVPAPWGYASLNLFRSDASDLIDAAGGGDPPVFTNLDDATLQGVEVACGTAVWDRLRLDVNYTYLDATAHDASVAGAGGSSEIQHKPAHRFNGILRVELPWRLRLRMEGLFTSEQVERLGTDVTVDGFAIWNAELTWTAGEHLSVFAGADNLLDADFEEKLGSPEPGRRAFAGFRATY